MSDPTRSDRSGDHRPDHAPHLAAVILHYGDPGLTDRVRRQLLAADPDRGADVLVLDNHAPQPWTGPNLWRRAEANGYWAGALAWAARELAASHTHLWFLNNDIRFDTGGPLLARAEARLARIAAREGRVGVWSPAARANPYHPQMVADEGLQYRRVRCVDGIAPCFDLACLRELGGVDVGENPYGYGVDVWTSLAADRAGWAVVVDHGVVIRHAYHTTARRVEGFLARAAAAEDRYLAARLGPDWRAELDRLKADAADSAEI